MQQNFDAQRFRQALGAFTTGVTIVTTVDAQGADIGVTANSFNSVSLSPPMVLWSLARTSTNIDAFLAARSFAVHVLASDQDALAARFSQRGVDRFAGLHPGRGEGGVPLLEGCAARFQCRTAFQYEGGDHVIFVGEVVGFEHWDHEPLVFKRGRFAVAVGRPRPPGPEQAAQSPGAFAQDFLIYLLGRAYHQLYCGVRPEILRRGLRDAEYFALSMLGMREGRTTQELDALLGYAGVQIDDRVAARLLELGLVERRDAAAEARLWLTAAGRRTLVELLAVAKAASADAEESLDASESRVLRELLARLIEASDPGVPAPWQPPASDA